MYKEIIKNIIPKLPTTARLWGANKELNVNNPKWEDADYKVAFALVGLADPKLNISSTLTSVFSLIRQVERERGLKIYIDTFVLPTPSEMKELRRVLPTPIIGTFSYREITDFDLFTSSVSIASEVVALYPLLRGMGYPLDPIQREGYPFHIIGGNIIDTLEFLNGDLERTQFYDIAYVGEGEERFPEVLKSIMDSNAKTNVDLALQLTKSYDNLYYPKGYEHIYCEDEPFKIKEIKKVIPEVQDKIKFYRTSCTDADPLFEERVLLQNSSEVPNGDILISKACSGAVKACSFCHEGNVTGTWREYSVDRVKDAIDKVRKVSAPSTLNYYSYNMNYYSNVYELYRYLAGKIANASVIAFRADVVAYRPDFLDLIKSLGTNSICFALEGISKRIRNGMFNKNVTEEQMLICVEEAVKRKFARVKQNLILSGLETQEDYEEFAKFIDKMIAIKRKYNSNSSFLFSGTFLCFYPNTALQWKPRTSIVAQIENRPLLKEIEAKYQDQGVGLKYNKGMSQVYLQYMLDMGRKGLNAILPLLEKAYAQNMEVNSEAFCSKLVNEIEDYFGFDTLQKKKDFFMRERSLDEIFPSQLMSVIPEKSKKLLYEEVKLEDVSRMYCLKTAANLNPKCTDCGVCETTEQKKALLNHSIEVKTTVPEVRVAYKNNYPKCALRVIMNVKDDPIYKFRSKSALIHRYTGYLIEKIPFIDKHFYKIENKIFHSMLLDNNKDVFHGMVWFDIQLKCNLNELKKFNMDDLKGLDISPIFEDNLQLVHVIPHTKLTKLMTARIKNKYIIDTKISLDEFSIRKRDIDQYKTGRLQESASMNLAEYRILKNKKNNHISLVLYLPANHNPIHYLSSITGYPINKCMTIFSYRLLNSYAQFKAFCPECQEQLYTSVVTLDGKMLCLKCKK